MRVRTEKWKSLAAVVAGLMVTFPLAGCEELERTLAQNCEDAERSYKQALADEETNLAEQDKLPERTKRPAHFGLTLSNKLLSDMANLAVKPVIKGVLELASTVNVGGQSVDLSTKGDVVDLSFQAHGACDHCFRLGIDLGGSIVAESSAFGREEASLDGAANIVAPIMLTEGEEKSVAVKLDLPKFAEYQASNVIARISGVSSDWDDRLRNPLSKLLTSALADNLKPVTLMEFNGPSFGIDGFELTPVLLQSDDDHGAVFAGFSTNIAALNEENMPGVVPVTDLADGQNIALSFQPQLILNVLSLLIGGDKVARRYTSDGEAADNGAFHITLNTFKVGQQAVGPGQDAGMVDAGFSADAASMTTGDGMSDDRAPVGLGFQVHNFGAGNLCFSAGARAAGGVGVANQALDVAISDVSFTSDTVPRTFMDLANWTSSQFITETQTLVTKSFDGKNLKVPGTKMNVGPLALGIRPNTFVVRGSSSLDAMSDEKK